VAVERFGAVVWFVRISAAGRSGLSARAYCRSQGWSYASFIAWRRRLCRELAGGAALRCVGVRR
jgi:hypothetical protein